VVLRRGVDQVVQRGEEPLAELGLPIVLAPVQQPGQTQVAEAGDDPVHPGDRAADALGDVRPTPALGHQQHDLAAVGQALVLGLAPHPAELELDPTFQPKDDLHRGLLFLWKSCDKPIYSGEPSFVTS